MYNKRKGEQKNCLYPIKENDEMTGREKIIGAFSKDGTKEIPVVICYERIFVRDHWRQLTNLPWYACYLPDIDIQIKWNEDVIANINQNWFIVFPFDSRTEREHVAVKFYQDSIVLINTEKNTERMINRPKVAGWSVSGPVQSVKIDKIPETLEEMEEILPEKPEKFDRDDFINQGYTDLASALIEKFPDKMPFAHVSSPLWRMYGIVGFEGMMTMMVTQPELIQYACESFLDIEMYRAQQYIACGAQVLWIEECLTDMISPAAFDTFNVPYLKKLISFIRECGGKSVYYYCGNPWDRMEKILQAGADAIAFEEGKKIFQIDIEKVVDIVDGKCTVFGNLDAINVLPCATEQQLKQEIERQIKAGIKNKRKFVMSIGSPVTPETPVERVRLYWEIAREIGTTI